MIDTSYLWYAVILLAVALLENIYLRRKIKKLTRKCNRWEGICAEHRAAIIQNACEKAMEGVAEDSQKEVDEYIRKGENYVYHTD